MPTHEQEKIRAAVRNRYAKAATGTSGLQKEDQSSSTGCCTGGNSPLTASTSGCGCGQNSGGPLPSATQLGYGARDLESTPHGANLGLGCGNPVALATLKKGEVVVDLGSGGGFDCFLAAKKVGPNGQVIGVDMTAEMISKARQNERQSEADNVEFRLGEIEHLPVADNSADIIMSNCVINLSTDKNQVFREAFRVLKPGGRLAIADILAFAPLPPEVQNDLALISACVGGAATLEETRTMLENAGFEAIQIDTNEESREIIDACAGGSDTGSYVTSAYVQARKPIQ